MDMKYETFLVDLSQDGLRMVFKDWETWVYLYVYQSNNPVCSADIHRAVKKEYDISRASVINFLERLNEAEVIDAEYVTGKGGHRALYSAKLSPSVLLREVQTIVTHKVDKFLLDPVTKSHSLVEVDAELFGVTHHAYEENGKIWVSVGVSDASLKVVRQLGMMFDTTRRMYWCPVRE